MLCADGVKIGIGERVDRIHEDKKKLRRGHADERFFIYSDQADEGNGKPTDEVREDEHRHALGHAPFDPSGRRARPRAPEAAVHSSVTKHNEEERQAVGHQQERDVAPRHRVLDVERKADGDLFVAADVEQRQRGHCCGEQPAKDDQDDDLVGVQVFVLIERMDDHEVALQRDDRENEGRQLGGEDRQEAGRPAAVPVLPFLGEVLVLTQRVQVRASQHAQEHSHAQVGERQVAHENLVNGHFAFACDEHEQFESVAEESEDQHEPGTDAQRQGA